MRELLRDTAERAANYLEGLADRQVAPSDAAVAALDRLGGGLPKSGTPASEVVAELDALAGPATMAMAGPRFFGFVIGGSTPAGLAANWLAGAWDQNTCIETVTPATSRLEQIARDWLLELLGLPADAEAAFVTGATVANFVSLAAARHAVLRRAGWDVEADGLIGAPDVRVIVSEETHPSVTKSLGLVGLGRTRVDSLPTDSAGRMRTESLTLDDRPTIICAQVGNVNTGASDPIGELAEKIEDRNVWLHVDGAFGLWLAASERHRDQLTGVELADSWATDAHKWLNVPYDSGLAIVRDRDALRSAMSITAAYLPMESGARNPADYTPELSRRARGVEIWAVLRELGAAGVEAMIDRHCEQARRFAKGLNDAGFEILAPVVMNQVLVSFGSPRRTADVIAAIQQEGTCWCGITAWQGHTAMRISVSGHSTTNADVDQSLAAMIAVAKRV